MIEEEIKARIDNHSRQVLISNIELLLNYCTRFYERQFNTRSAQNKDVTAKVESLLKEYYRSNKIHELGQPTITYLANECHVSAGYLSDLLKKETGKPPKTTSMIFWWKKQKIS
ncbi:MAG: hypothetical protein R2788_14580 [Saprospiraceae bacterium]